LCHQSCPSWAKTQGHARSELRDGASSLDTGATPRNTASRKMHGAPQSILLRRSKLDPGDKQLKKPHMALAVLTAFAGTASAQSSVTIFGIIDLSLRNVTNRTEAGSVSQRTVTHSAAWDSAVSKTWAAACARAFGWRAR
jgi:hypothetical protein